MAPGTRGRDLFDGKPTLRIHGRDVPVRAAVARIPALSGHADHRELLRWLAPLPPPKITFLTHGEPHSAQMLAEQLTRLRGWNTVVPKHGESFELPDVVVL
jgi:metallo-beta-lactamase family protein